MANSKFTKKALISSVVALLLCVTMLLGTTFAWFTDSVESTGNIIKSGNLEVEMSWAENLNGEATVWNNVEGDNGTIFDYDLWEPGYSQVRYVKIANTGNLALKYMLNIVPNGDVSNLAEVIDVYFAKVDDEANFGAPTEFADVEGLDKVGTLADLIADADGAAYGVLLPEEGEGANDVDSTEADALNAEIGSVTVCLVLHMQESAGNEYEDMSIGSTFDLSLLATQFTYEEDSFNNDYDANADYVASYTSGVHTLYDEYFVSTGDTLAALHVEGEGTAMTIMGGYYDGNAERDPNKAVLGLYANDKAVVDIVGGTFRANAGGAAVLANGGAIVNIYGGFFEVEGPHADVNFVLNLQDNTDSVIKVYGGTFVNFDPSETKTEPAGVNDNFVAEGYTVVEEQHGDETWYIVRPEATVETANALTDALTNGTPVTLTADIELDEPIVAGGNVTIYGDGHEITMSDDTKDSSVIKVNGVENPVINISGVTLSNVGGANSGRVISVSNCTGDVVINITDSVIVNDKYYGLNIASNDSADSITISVKDSVLEGFCAFQTWTKNTTAFFENCTLTGTNQWDPASGTFATIVVNTPATDCNLTFNNCELYANYNGATEYHLSDRSGNAVVTWNNCTYYINNVEGVLSES